MLKSESVVFSEEFKQKSAVEKRKIILKLHQQFSHPSSEYQGSSQEVKCYR